MRVELASLEDGRGSFAYTYGSGELNLEDERVNISQPPTVLGDIWKKNGEVKVSGRVIGELELECDRCLQPVKLPVSSTFGVELVTAEDYQAREALELTEQDLNLEVFDGETVDVDSLVKEELLLAVPDQVLCDENCQGICPVCGANKNLVKCDCATEEIDPRWAELKKIVNSEG